MKEITFIVLIWMSTDKPILIHDDSNDHVFTYEIDHISTQYNSFEQNEYTGLIAAIAKDSIGLNYLKDTYGKQIATIVKTESKYLFLELNKSAKDSRIVSYGKIK